MSQDFAKRKKNSGARKSARNAAARPRAQQVEPRGRGLRLYLGGVLTGVFLSFIGYLTTLSEPATQGQEGADNAPAAEEVPKPRFDFYTLLPEQTLEVEEVVEPAADVSKPAASAAVAEPFVLQAGSFRQLEDAERRRAELLLLGLDPKIQESTSDSGRWFRVYLGPFDSQNSMSRARSLTAGQGIETLVLKRGSP